MSFLGALAEAATLLILARIAFALANGSKPVAASVGSLLDVKMAVGTLVVLAAVLVVLRFGLQFATFHVQANLYGEVLEDVRARTMRSYLAASWSEQSDDREGRLQELVGNFAQLAAGQMGAMTALLVAFFSLVAMLGTALFANALATLMVGGAAVLLVLVMRPFRRAVRRRSQRTAASGLAFGTAVNEVASMSLEMHVFGVQQPLGSHLGVLGAANRRAVERLQVLGGVLPAFYQAAALLVVVGGVGVVYAVGGTRLASLGAVLLIGVRSLSYGQAVQSSIQALHSGLPFLEIVNDESARYLSAAVTEGPRSVDRVDDLVFEDVTYSYDGARFALKGVSFAAKRGQAVGIVGPSGSGKSTLVQLILRLREPSSGRILVNGLDIQETRLTDWARRVTFVPQDAHLFSGTVAENIRFFREDISDGEIEVAARRAHLHEEVLGWPDGYLTRVGERGRKLSGGQRQRLTIARALAGQPEIVVMDEPTSNLDVQSEAAIRATLVELSERTLVFVIAHRLSTLDVCDRIMVIQDGEMRGFDEPRQLEESSSFYREALRLSGLR